MEIHGEAPGVVRDGSTPGRVPFGTPTKHRSVVEMPAWVVDELLASAKPVALRLAMGVYRHGWETRGPQGERRLWWRGSMQELARRIGATKPAVIEAERFLAGVGLLTVHRSNDARRPHAISMPLDPSPSGKNFQPLPESETAQHGGAPEIPHFENLEVINTTTTTEEAVGISNRLRELGVTNPEAWLHRAGPARCLAALEYFDSLEPSRFSNPAGFLHTLVFGRGKVPKPAHVERPPQTFEERKAKYLGGSFQLQRLER